MRYICHIYEIIDRSVNRTTTCHVERPQQQQQTQPGQAIVVFVVCTKSFEQGTVRITTDASLSIITITTTTTAMAAAISATATAATATTTMILPDSRGQAQAAAIRTFNMFDWQFKGCHRGWSIGLARLRMRMRIAVVIGNRLIDF